MQITPAPGVPTLAPSLPRAGDPLPLPRRLRNSRNLSAQRQAAETQPADPKLAQVRARASAQLTAIVPARGKLRPRLLAAHLIKLCLDLCVLHSLCCSQFTFHSWLSARS